MKKEVSIFNLVVFFVSSFSVISAQNETSTITAGSNTSVEPVTAPASKVTEDEGIYKHTQFGLRISPSYNNFNVVSKTMESGGGMAKFGAGLLIETHLTKNVVFQSGIGVDVFGGKITYSNDPSGLPDAYTNRFLYDGPEEAIAEYKLADRNKTGFTEFMLLERDYKMTYITAPVNLRMKTNRIGGLKYFGQLGLDFQFRWSSFATDRVQQITNYDDATSVPIELGPSQTLSKVNINDDVSFLNMSVNTGLGIEKELGGVDLFVSFNYHFGVFSPVHKESDRLNKVYQASSGKLEASPLKQEYRTRVFALTIGFMF